MIQLKNLIFGLYNNKFCYILILTIWTVTLKLTLNFVNQTALLLTLVYFPIIYTIFLFFFKKKYILNDYELDVLNFLIKAKEKLTVFRNINLFLSILIIIINLCFCLYELFFCNNIIIAIVLIVLLTINIFITSFVEYKLSELKFTIITFIRLLEK